MLAHLLLFPTPVHQQLKAIEGDFEWSPLDGLYVGGAFTYLDFTFDEFIGGCTAAQDIAFRAANNTTVNTPMGPLR